ncbi:NAD-dependent epimerase/dehydratase family protein [Micrococcus sp.]|uniref:NAD-dependent epimerase/dehydratase family protein n=1 Tax=Micrococcus sp. TaxID=1271 RepID=UPI002A90B436|nr:NAD-dependent epimerase/dehydratase family protein [Micrococcus sp.]MDY6055526.1 NAD-dependent epimerase/dehydratase family protein [Micrococcus sp.]
MVERVASRRVLVTGASGLLGAGVARALAEAGDAVTTLQRRPSGVQGARDVRGSVTDADAVAEALEGADTVVHVAAKVSVSGPEEEFETVNVGGTGLLAEAARARGVRRFVHVSSPSVAHAGDSIVGEGAGPASPERARGPYARTKAAGERLVLGMDAPDFRVLVLRPHLMWGPGDLQLTDRIVQRARAGRMPVLGTGAALIDTLYTGNAVEATVAAVSAVDHTHGEALVVTNGEPRPVGELVRQIALAGGAPEPERRVPAGLARRVGALVERAWERDLFGLRSGAEATGDGEPPLTEFLAEQLSTAHWFDQRRTREVLGWTPSVSIDEGLHRLAAYYRSR